MENTTTIKAKYTPSTQTLTLICFILFAGVLDLVTSLVGTYYSPLIEVNAINLIVNFPVGVFVWVGYFILFTYFCGVFVWKMKPKAQTKDEIDTIKIMDGFPYFLALIAFLIPIHNLMLILGVGFL